MSLRRSLGLGIAILVFHQTALLALIGAGAPPRLSILLAAVLLLLCPLLLSLRVAGVPAGPALRLRRVPGSTAILGVLAFLCAIPPIVAVTGRAAHVTERMEQFFDALLRAESPAEWIWVLFVVAVVPAVTEEILFRGYLQRTLETRTGRWPAILIVAVVFGVIHGSVRAPTAIALAIPLGWLASRTDSIVPTMIAHATANALVVMLANTGVAAPEGSPEVPWGLAAAAAVASAALFTAFARSTGRSGSIPWSEDAPSFPRRERDTGRPDSK